MLSPSTFAADCPVCSRPRSSFRRAFCSKGTPSRPWYYYYNLRYIRLSHKFVVIRCLAATCWERLWLSAGQYFGVSPSSRCSSALASCASRSKWNWPEWTAPSTMNGPIRRQLGKKRQTALLPCWTRTRFWAITGCHTPKLARHCRPTWLWVTHNVPRNNNEICYYFSFFYRTSRRPRYRHLSGRAGLSIVGQHHQFGRKQSGSAHHQTLDSSLNYKFFFKKS